MNAVRPGEVIAGKFRIERLLGEGGMGYVVAARHLQLGQMVALKFMRKEVCTPDYKSRFLREARNTVRLKSKHVSRVLDVGSLEGGSPYMVMEYLEGTDLSELLQQRGPMPAWEVCEYVLQACEAVHEAHGHGIIHRDLKPANLFLTRGQGGEPVVKVLDFGVSKVLDLGMDAETNPGGRPRDDQPESVVTKATDLLGSPSYMAPEQIISARDADVRSDVWSLGVILFRLISGKAPFQGSSLGELIQAIVNGPIPSLREARPDAPAGLEHIIARCLERDRQRRLGDVSELARLLAPYAGPVTSPSLERIAILGPALVAAAPTPGSTSSLSSAMARSAWSSASAPPPPSTRTPRPDISASTAIVWGAIFVGAVACSAILVASLANLKRTSHQAPTAATVPSQPTVMPPPPPTSEPDAPHPNETAATAVASAPLPPPLTKPAKGGHGKSRGSSRPSPDAIPTSRE